MLQWLRNVYQLLAVSGTWMDRIERLWNSRETAPEGTAACAKAFDLDTDFQEAGEGAVLDIAKALRTGGIISFFYKAVPQFVREISTLQEIRDKVTCF